jgi:hypothetical protein
LSSTEWPRLEFADWEATCDTVHMWTQIVGKTRMLLAPPVNHFWHVPLYVTPRGLTTSAMPYGNRTFEVAFDFLTHNLEMRTSDGGVHSMPLFARPVADFYAEYMACLRSLGIEVKINRVPVEFDDTTPFDEDRHHASYDRDAVGKFRQILVASDRVLNRFRSGFVGKCSPVHFFWGSFDLAVTRFSGRRAPPKEGTDHMTAEAYSHEVISCGFWPGDRRYKHAAYYSYTVPVPAGLEKESVRPPAAHWNAQMGEFLLNYEDVRREENPEKALQDFCLSAYAAGANLAGWDRKELEATGTKVA